MIDIQDSWFQNNNISWAILAWCREDSGNVWLMLAQPIWLSVASFTKEVNQRLANCPLKTNGRLANHGLTSLVKEATGVYCVLL